MEQLEFLKTMCLLIAHRWQSGVGKRQVTSSLWCSWGRDFYHWKEKREEKYIPGNRISKTTIFY
jgi:hypothetical protein